MPDGEERVLIRTYLRNGSLRVCEVEDESFLSVLSISVDLLEISRKIIALGLAGPYREELERTVLKAVDFNRSPT